MSGLAERLLDDIAHFRSLGVKPRALYVADGVCDRLRLETGLTRPPGAPRGVALFDGVELVEREGCTYYGMDPGAGDEVGINVVQMDFDNRVVVIVSFGGRTARRDIDLKRYSGLRVGREALLKGAIYSAEQDALAELKAGGGEPCLT